MGITAFPFSSVIDVPTARILGRDDAGTGSAEALTNAEIFAILGTGTPSASTYLRGDGTWAAVSAGISSLNGLTDATQTFAVGTTGTNVAFSSAAGVHTLNIPDASLSARGVINTGSQNIQGVKSFYTGVEAAYVNMFSWWGLGDGANGGVQFFAGHGIAWGSAANGAPVRNSLSGDVQLRRDAAGRLGQRSGTTAQAAGVYNTFTSDTSFERLNIAWASNVCYIGTEKGSAGGTARDLTLGTDGAVRLVLPAATTSGALYLGPRADNTATGGNARGANAVDLQTSRGLNTQVASGQYSFVSGFSNTATNRCSVAFGYESVTTGDDACAIGQRCTASGNASMSININARSSGAFSFASGLNSVADRVAMRAHASGSFAATGDSQYARFVARAKTTGTTPGEMRMWDLDGGSNSYRLTIPSGKILHATVQILGSKSDGTAVASYIRQVTIKNVGGTTSLVGTVNTIGTDEAAGTSIAITADNTNDALQINVTGVTSETWRWVAVVYGVELAYGT